MTTTTGSNYSQPPKSYPPSVPLCVYQELTAELQAVQSKLDAVTSHNQKLSQENQQLRQEITKVIQSCLELQNLVGTSAPSLPAPVHSNHEVRYQPQPQPTPPNHNEIRHTNKPNITTASPRQQPTSPRQKTVAKAMPPQNLRQESTAPIKNVNFPVSETVFIEEEKVRYSPNPRSQTKVLNGWWLVMTIILIMMTGFAAGYLIVRPLFQNQSQPIREIKN